ncbi:hypothetical protein DS6A_39 [Mycobacterium phage DS6A]|uniref:Uncharacterized protein n=1 Tax=Mycobacterium phage DS6A TaxID=45764 RepID=G8I4E9_9CAUD|nr:hypothetical protein DS6A_39 [Mycobacterium phage DS6A]AER47593.1 hypothetical protein DS6A_39 [Mycobacterium phage DS6A]
MTITLKALGFTVASVHIAIDPEAIAETVALILGGDDQPGPAAPAVNRAVKRLSNGWVRRMMSTA